MKRMRAILIVYAIGWAVTAAYDISRYDCRSWDRQTCRALASGDGYMAGLVWPLYWTFEVLHT